MSLRAPQLLLLLQPSTAPVTSTRKRKEVYRRKCKGTITWAARTNSSCIDYCLISPGLLPQLTDMHVDENGEESIGSDHHSIKLRFGAQAYPTRLPGAQTGSRSLSDAEIEEVAGWMEEEAVQKDMETF